MVDPFLDPLDVSPVKRRIFPVLYQGPNLPPGFEVTEIPASCCGLAGAFGYEKEHYDISMSVGEQTLFPAIRSQHGDFDVVSDGVSCRQQIEHATGRRAKHLVEVLAEAL